MTPRLDVELFEHVPASADTVLLRVEGRWHAEQRGPLPMPLLVVDDGRRTERLPPIPGPDVQPPQAGPEPALWRGAYAAPAAVLQESRVVFALDAGRGVIADLPRPQARGTGRLRGRSSAAELAHERALRAEAERLADERRRALREAEAELDRERAARSAETVRADAATAQAAQAAAELESAREHARADAAQQVRDGQAAAAALAAAQARVQELDAELAAQRRRTLEAESAAAQAAQEHTDALVAEEVRGAEAVAAQRALAEEATRAAVAAQAQAREHAARATDLEIARDELRERLERERERVRTMSADTAGELAVEERRRVRELQARAETAERRAADAERRLEAVAAREGLEVGPGEAALVAELAQARSASKEAKDAVRSLTGELVQAGEARTALQDELASARARLAELEAGAATGPPAPSGDGGEAERLGAELAAERQARARAEEEARLAIQERAELERALQAERARPAAPEPEPEPEPAPLAAAAPEAGADDAEAEAAGAEPGGAVAVFGPFGDAGPATAPDPAEHEHEHEHDDLDLHDEDFDMETVIRRWDTDEYELPEHAGQDAGAVPARRARGSQSIATAPEHRSTRGAILLGVAVAAVLLVALRITGVLGAAGLAPF